MKQSIVRRTESLLNDIEVNIQRGDMQSAAVSLCHAYSLAPRRTKKQLRRIEREALKDLVKILEKFCTENNQESSLSVKKISELILLPEVDPNNSVAWRVRLWMLLESEEYEEVVLNTDRLESMPKSKESADLYLTCSLAHMKVGVPETGIELYLRAFNIDAEKANKCMSEIGKENRDVIYNTFLEKASQLHRSMSLSDKDSVDMLNYYGEILRLRPSDAKSSEIYGQLLMKVGSENTHSPRSYQN
jgi:tetratricopeptide (TPR) repeat protein